MNPDLILLHAPSVYDFRKITTLYGPVSDQIPSSPVFEMYPIGLTSIAEYLERYGYRVRIVNLAVRMLKDPDFDAEAMIRKLKAPVFGIDLHWLVHCHGSIEIAKLVKKYHPRARLMFGGFSSSYFYRELIDYPEIDYVLRGDSTEEPVRQLMDCIKNNTEPETVPNLVWRDKTGNVRENPFTYVPNDLSDVMTNHYTNTVRSVLRYRDFTSYLPFQGWTDYPITAIITCRGCNENCVICGGSGAAGRMFLNRGKPVFRSPQAVARDVKQIVRFSNAPVFILGDPRQAGDEYASELFKELQKLKFKNQLIFEIFTPANTDFFIQMRLCSPNFCLEMSPESHDPEVRRAEGRNFSNEELEDTIGSALEAGCERLDIFFMIGVPRQTPQSALDTVEYCGYLMEKFKGDKRLFLFIAPLAPFLDPGSLAFEQPERHGYHILYHTLAEHRNALIQPGWKYSINYETDWMTREQIVDTAYRAMTRLNQLKATYGVITQKMADAENKRLKSARDLIPVIDDMIAQGNYEAKLASLKARIDEINMSPSSHWEELKTPMGLIKVKFLSSLWSWLTRRM